MKPKDTRPQFSYELLMRLQLHSCFYCNKKLDSIGHCQKTAKNGYTRDHFFSQAMGNRMILGNLVLSCAKCNRRKGSSLPGPDEVKRYHILWSQIKGGPALDLSEFFAIQRLIDITIKLIGYRVDTCNII